MNKLSIIYNQPLTQVQGINYVNNSFVMGMDYFKKSDIELYAIYSPSDIFECKGRSKLDLIGSNVGTSSYARERRIRTFFKKMLSSEYLLGACIKLYFNYYYNAQKAVKKYLSAKDKCDYVLFQDVFSAYYYFKNIKSMTAKTVLLLHCSNEPLEQMRPSFKGVFKYKWATKIVERHVNYAISQVDKVVYLSQLALNNSSLDTSRKTYIYNGVEDCEIGPIKNPEKIINIVTVGSVIEHKGQHLVIQSLTLMDSSIRKRFHYHIIGAGDNLDNCKDLVKCGGLDDYVTFYGSRSDVAELLKTMDVFILPSRSEGMPMSIIEAMRQGLYVIGTETGGIPEMITPDYGRLIDRDPHSIMSALLNLIDGNVLTKDAKLISRTKYLESFSLKKMINSYSLVFNSL